MNPLVDPSQRPVIAHRGASAQAPENTMPAFEQAADLAADALELDVHLSADGVPVVIHDPTLDRTTDRRGPVAACTLAELREADAGATFSPDGGGSFPWRGREVRIPTLIEVLERLPELPLLIELKSAAVQHAVRHLLEQQDAAGRCLVASADHAAVAVFREPPFLACASRRDIVRLLLRAHLAVPTGPIRYRALSVPDRHRGFPVPTTRFIAAARRLGLPVHVWTVNDPVAAQALWRKGAAGIVTNDPAKLRQVRDASWR
ncbi:MAG: glycerophosphodiester phosphodiesterase family protein [Gemmatimonadales bacterium]